jgi:endonuclease YncB( thermonuclease family)
VYVFADGENVNIEMVRLGWSKHYIKYGTGKYKEKFKAAETEAREAGRGLWN